jgi:hypothetical protein
MTRATSYDRYLMGCLSTDNAVSMTALRRALSIDADCSPFEVQLYPLKQAGPSVLYVVTLPRSARSTYVTDIWPLGRLSLIDDIAEQERLISVTSTMWPLLCSTDDGPVMTSVRLGDPVLFAFQLKRADKFARVFSSGLLGHPTARSHRGRTSYNWTRDWLVRTLGDAGWRVTETSTIHDYRAIDWAIGQ